MGQRNPIPISAPVWADDADQLPGRISASGKRGVDACRDGGGADADDDSRMSALGCVRKDPR